PAAAAAAPPPPPPPPPPAPLLQPPAPPPAPKLQLLQQGGKEEVPLPPAMVPKSKPAEGKKMRALQWAKIPVARVAATSSSCTNNIWMRATCSKNDISVDYSTLDTLFGLSEAPSVAVNAEKERKASNASSARKESVNLLCSRRSLQANIFLKQMKDSAALVDDIREGRGACAKEILVGLAAVLPDKEEVTVLRGYTGDTTLLAPAEQFFLSLIEVPDYALRLDCLLFRRHFHSAMEEIAPLLSCLQSAIQELIDSRSLGRLLLTIVRVGNYLNHGNTQGNAAGFKLNSLWKVADVRASRAKDGAPSLLHYLAELDSDCVRDLDRELPTLSAAAKISIEFVKSEFESIRSRRRTLCDRLAVKEEQYFADEKEYLEDHCTGEIEEVDAQLKKLTDDQARLRCHFCDDSLKMEETLKIVAHFVARLATAAKENDVRAARATIAAAAAATCGVHTSQSDNTLETKPSSKSLRRSRTFVPSTEDEATLECLLLRDNRTSLTSSRRRISILPQSSSVVSSGNLEDYLTAMETERNPTKVIRRRSTIRQTSADLPQSSAATLHDALTEAIAESKPEPEASSAIHLEVLESTSGGDSSSSVSPKSSDEGFDSDQKEPLVATTSPVAKAETPSRVASVDDHVPPEVEPPEAHSSPTPPTPVTSGRPIRKTVSITTSPTEVAKVRRPPATVSHIKPPSPSVVRSTAPSKIAAPAAAAAAAGSKSPTTAARTPTARPAAAAAEPRQRTTAGFSASKLTSPGLARRPARPAAGAAAA
ncbi:hypothetical protein PFISCL1PPCAC_12199, partial [Pristionchus fissidentatus]